MNKSDIGKAIKQARLQRGLSCRELGELSGTSAATVSRIENGKRKATSTESLFKLLEALDIRIDISEDPVDEVKIVYPYGLIPSIQKAIDETIETDAYSRGYRNGLKIALFLITGQEQHYNIIKDEEGKET